MAVSGVASRRQGRLGRAVLWVLTAVPAVSVALFYSVVIRARIAHGHWPREASASPNELGFTGHYWIWLASLPALFMAALLMAVVLLMTWYRWPAERRRLAAAVVVFVGLLLISVALYRSDLGGLSAWMGMGGK